jgi:hypothetical protein
MSQLTWPQKHDLLSKLLKRKKHYPSSVCCLWVDANSWLELFAEHHATWGVVAKKEQLAAAKEQFSQAKLYGQTLQWFRLPAKMQLIYQLNTSIHSLVGEQKREKFFQKVHDHLEPYGIYVFDLYLWSHFEHHTKQWWWVTLWDDLVSIDSRKEKKWLYTRNAVTFTEQESGLYTREQISDTYQTFTVPAINKLLKGFDSVEVVDTKGRKATAKSNHVVVVVQKGR